MGAHALHTPNRLVWCHGAPAPGRAARTARALEIATREGLCRTHAFCALPTGLSALVSCPDDQTEALRDRFAATDVAAVRWAMVGSPLQARLLVSHLDAEPVRAGLAADPRRYPFGSLGLRQTESNGWMEDAWLRREAMLRGGYFAAFPALCRPRRVALQVARTVRVGGAPAPLETFVRGPFGTAANLLTQRLGNTRKPLAPIGPARPAGSAAGVGADRCGLVMLRALGGLSADEIARDSGTTPRAVEAELHDAALCLAADAPALVEATALACEIAADFYAPWQPAATRALPRAGLAGDAPRGISA
jgi:hypothetical protein